MTLSTTPPTVLVALTVIDTTHLSTPITATVNTYKQKQTHL